MALGLWQLVHEGLPTEGKTPAVTENEFWELRSELLDRVRREKPVEVLGEFVRFLGDCLEQTAAGTLSGRPLSRTHAVVSMLAQNLLPSEGPVADYAKAVGGAMYPVALMEGSVESTRNISNPAEMRNLFAGLSIDRSLAAFDTLQTAAPDILPPRLPELFNAIVDRVTARRDRLAFSPLIPAREPFPRFPVQSGVCRPSAA